jgi:hypothetical protein
MAGRQSEFRDSVALEIELDDYGRFFADHPSIMTGFYHKDLRSPKVKRATIGVLDMDVAACEEPYVSMHA